jgi:hypothetical protein
MLHTWLPMARLAVLAIAAACAPLAAQQTTVPAAIPADVASPEAITLALYDVISGPGTQPRDWDRFRSLFLPGARLIYSRTNRAGEEQLHPMTVEDFIRIVTPEYARSGFWERDVGHRTERFGNVAHVFTAYETRGSGSDGPVVARGINSVQLVRHQGRWWIANIAWDTERPGNPIPPEFMAPRHE